MQGIQTCWLRLGLRGVPVLLSGAGLETGTRGPAGLSAVAAPFSAGALPASTQDVCLLLFALLIELLALKLYIRLSAPAG